MPASNKLLDLITIVDNVPLDFEQNHDPYYTFHLAPSDARPHGYILPKTVNSLPWPASFVISHDTRTVTITEPPPPAVAVSVSNVTESESASETVSDAARSAEHVNRALQDAVDAALASTLFPTLSNTHSEPFLIPGARHGPVHLERFAATLFGIATRGSHMTAYTRSPPTAGTGAGPIDGIWVARRSAALFTYPSKLDSTVAGGVKATDTPTGCILAEAAEEASLPDALFSHTSGGSSSFAATGVITLANRNPRTGLFHSEILYVYDLELPSHIVPIPSDGEVDEFILMSVDEVRRRMEDGEFKPNVCPVMIDFMMRHGFITPESEGEGPYADISNRLHRRLPVPLASDR